VAVDPVPGARRRSAIRWGLVTAPAILAGGLASSRIAGSTQVNPWWEGLAKPALQPPDWAFGVAWPILYTLLGVALAIVIATRTSRLRGLAIGLFLIQLAMNYAWSPLFFRAHNMTGALTLIAAMFVTALATAVVFGRVRRIAGWLMVPYLAWLSFAAGLNWKTVELNPDGGPRVELGTEVAVPQK
jgi:tryptophan-rich sensory protein